MSVIRRLLVKAIRQLTKDLLTKIRKQYFDHQHFCVYIPYSVWELSALLEVSPHLPIGLRNENIV